MKLRGGFGQVLWWPGGTRDVGGRWCLESQVPRERDRAVSRGLGKWWILQALGPQLTHPRGEPWSWEGDAQRSSHLCGNGSHSPEGRLP